MKRWIFLILAIIIISIFGIIKSCQRDKREVINIYTDREIENFIGKLSKKGIPILDITQCISGSVKMPLYESTDKLSKLGIINGSDITSEAGLTKMMYLLGKNLSLQEIKNAFTSSICGEQTV